MARNVTKRGWLGIGVTVLVLGVLVIVAVWQSLAQSTNPDYQHRTEHPAVGGEYFVNLWIDPHPPETGDTEISAQLTTIIGSSIELSYLHLDLERPDDGSTMQLDTEHTFDGPNDGDLYVARTTFDEAGTWRVIVRYSFGGSEVVDEFDIEVSE